MELLALGAAPASASHIDAESWPSRLRRLWVTRRHPDPAYVLGGLDLQHRLPAAQLGVATGADFDSVVLLLNHAHAGAMASLQTLRATHARRFHAGSVVVAVENLPAEAPDALLAYRRAAQAPVFAVDLRLPCDRLLLQEALVATRVAAALYHAAHPAA